MPKISLKKAKEIGDKLRVNYDVVPLKWWKYAIEVELEHGKMIPYTNVTKNDLMMTAKIALAHLIEFPDYYQRLKRMEEQAENYWKKKRKPPVYLKKRKTTSRRKSSTRPKSTKRRKSTRSRRSRR